MDIKLIFSDIDGTILPRKGKISPSTVEAVRRCREKGTEFVLASGRWYPSALKIANQLGIDDGYMVVSNGGAVVRCDGTVLMESGMTAQQALAAYEVLRSEPVMITCYVRKGIFRLRSQYLTKFRLPEVSSCVNGENYDVVDGDEQTFVDSLMRTPYKMEVYSDDESILPGIHARLEAAGLQVNASFPFNLEIMAPGTGKGAAVRWLTAYMHLEREQVMGFGDYTNDLPMLENVGWPVAVGNALEEVKQVCRIIALDCADDGVAKIIQQYILGDE